MEKEYQEKKIEEISLGMKDPNWKNIIAGIIESIYDEGYEDGQNDPDMDNIREGISEAAQFRRDSMD